MESLRNRQFKSADDLCDFANNDPYVQVVSINAVNEVYQEPNGIVRNVTEYVLFYKEDERDYDFQ